MTLAPVTVVIVLIANTLFGWEILLVFGSLKFGWVIRRYADWAQAQGIHLPTLCEVKFVVDNSE